MRYSDHCFRLPVILLAACTIFVGAAGAQDSKEPIDLLLTPQAIEKPLLKYRLFPAEYELKKGNAATILLRMPWDQRIYMSRIFGTFEDDLELALDDPQIIENGTQGFEGFYRQLKRAAYRSSADWEYPIGEEPAAYILLPDVQEAREFVGRELSVWIRYHLATGDLDKAREGILVGLAVSRHYVRTPFLVVQFFGLSIDLIMLNRVRELVSHPDCPNLYWPLTAIPRPLYTGQPSIEFEERMFEQSIAGLVSKKNDPKSGDDSLSSLHSLDSIDIERPAKEWEKLAIATVQLYRETGGLGQISQEEGEKIIPRLAQIAREELPREIEGGKSRVDKMTDAEAGMRWLLLRNREQTQEITAMMALEPRLALPALRDLQNRLEAFRRRLGVKTLFNLETPLNAYIALRRSRRQIAILRTVEAIRHYAATHDGQLPETLDDCIDTPVPHDPLLTKPFDYKRANGTALLSAEEILLDGIKVNGIQYRMRLRSAK